MIAAAEQKSRSIFLRRFHRSSIPGGKRHLTQKKKELLIGWPRVMGALVRFWIERSKTCTRYTYIRTSYLSEDEAEAIHGSIFPKATPFKLQPQAPVEHHALPELRELLLLRHRKRQKIATATAAVMIQSKLKNDMFPPPEKKTARQRGTHTQGRRRAWSTRPFYLLHLR